MTRTRRAIYGVVTNYASVFVMAVAGFVLVPIVLRYLSREDYGLWATLGQVLGYLALARHGNGERGRAPDGARARVRRPGWSEPHGLDSHRALLRARLNLSGRGPTGLRAPAALVRYPFGAHARCDHHPRHHGRLQRALVSFARRIERLEGLSIHGGGQPDGLCRQPAFALDGRGAAWRQASV